MRRFTFLSATLSVIALFASGCGRDPGFAPVASPAIVPPTPAVATSSDGPTVTPVAAVDSATQAEASGGTPQETAKEVVEVVKTPATGEKCETDCKAGCMPGDTATIAAKGSHKQTLELKPLHNGNPISLNTFCVTTTGDILACVGDDFGGDAKPTTMVQVYGPDLKLKQEIPVKFKPTAINPAVDGQSFYVAGEGRIARIAIGGETLVEATAPNIGDPEKFKEVALAAHKRDLAKQTKTYTDNITRIQNQLKKIEEVAEEERTDRQKAQIEAYKSQVEQLESIVKQFDDQTGGERADQILKQKMTITALAVTGQDVFVCCRALRGYGYEVWRTTLDLNQDEGVVIIDNISGCCGQLDIQAQGEHLLIAENGKFQVATYDRDGEEVARFGKRDRNVIEGWGSCCNPMNIRCLSNGNVLVAESSIGNLKTYDKDGKFISYVGKAKVSGGCKHVACGYDAERNRYYFMNVDKGHICVLVPSSEAPAVSEEEKLAQEAREGLGKKLTGVWLAAKTDKAAADVPSPFPGATGIANRIELKTSGELTAKGGVLGQFAGPGRAMECNPAKQDGQKLECRLLMDGVDQWGLQVEFVDDNTVKIGLPELMPGNAVTFYREGTRPAEDIATDEPKNTLAEAVTEPLIIIEEEAEVEQEATEKPDDSELDET